MTTSSRPLRLDDSYFERVYARSSDPWGFETRWYEKRKYALTLAALPRPRYRRAFEPGCAGGVLTAELSTRCDALVAFEPVPRIASRARERAPAADVRVGALPEDWPEGRFDLVVASEVLYYVEPEGFFTLSANLEASLEPGGHLVAVHWRLETDYPMRGDEVHARLGRLPFIGRIHHYEQKEFLLDVFDRTP